MRLTELVTPLKPLEAMAQGRMFVASDVGGHRELIRDGETGFLFPAGDARRAGARDRARSSPRRAEWPRLSAQARRFVEAERTWVRSVARYAEVYESLLGPPPPWSARCLKPARTLRRMCGIYGICSSTAPCRRRRLCARWRAVTVHRGPDDEGAHADGRCAIGMRRLSIIDCRRRAPAALQRGRHAVARRNGEIYNFRELRGELTRRAIGSGPPRTARSSLHLYEQYGDAFVERLNGMFGFALWDARRQRLLVGRDRLGIKPLYLCNDGRRLAFATEAKALLALPGVTAELDPAALSSYLELGYVPAPQSIFRGIRKLPPATVLIAERGRVEERRYWRVPADDRPPADRGRMGGTACARGSRNRCACRWSATCRSARSCRAASIRARWSRSWPRTAIAR